MHDINITILDIDNAIADARDRGDVIAEREYEAIAVGFRANERHHGLLATERAA